MNGAPSSEMAFDGAAESFCICKDLGGNGFMIECQVGTGYVRALLLYRFPL
jgi:hypothetical protein